MDLIGRIYAKNMGGHTMSSVVVVYYNSFVISIVIILNGKIFFSNIYRENILTITYSVLFSFLVTMISLLLLFE